MKKIINLLVVASLAMAGAVMAQEPTPEASQPPGKKHGPEKKEQSVEKAAPTRPPKSQAPAVKENPALNQAPATTPTMTAPPTNLNKKSNKTKTPAATAPNTSAEQSATNATTSATPDMTKNQSRRNKNAKTPAANASTTPGMTPSTATTTATPKTKATSSPAAAKTTTTPAPTVATTPAASAAATAATTPGATMTPAAATAPSAGGTTATSPSQTTTTNVAAAKKPDPTKVQQIRQQHMSFQAQPRPDRVPAVTFTPNYRIQNSERWQGPQYEVYRSYHPERHDRGWYHQHYQRVELIAGGYYFFNNGYWYPAWGYDQGHEYYAYDAPIYVGKRSDPPDKVIADVQAALQDMGYYKGEVDGLMGPLTREALTGYQTDNGMTVTAVIDEPTLDSLNMG